MPTPPQTITLSPASAPAAPGTITLSAASAPAAPSTITLPAASAPSAPGTIDLSPEGLSAYSISGMGPAAANGYILRVTDTDLPGDMHWTTDGTATVAAGYFTSVLCDGGASSTWSILILLDDVEIARWDSTETFTTAPLPHLVETWTPDTGTYPAMTGSPVFSDPLSPPPATISLTAASQPAAPGVITPS